MKAGYRSELEYYKVLNLEPHASLDEIKKRYRELALKYHPDRNPQNNEQSESKFKMITEAYNSLMNKHKEGIQIRKDYYAKGCKRHNSRGACGKKFKKRCRWSS